MIFMYIVGGTAFVLLFSVGLAVLKQKQIKINVLSRESVVDKEFFALRIESDDFLFLKDEDNVTFIQTLDDVDDYQIVNHAQQSTKKQEQESFPGDKLVMPGSEKKAS